MAPCKPDQLVQNNRIVCALFDIGNWTLGVRHSYALRLANWMLHMSDGDLLLAD